MKEGIKIYIGDMAKEKLLETLTADVEVCYENRYWFYAVYIICCNENFLVWN